MDDGWIEEADGCACCDDGEVCSECQDEDYAGDWRDYGGYGDDD
mgnify:CR=1 FL=1